MKEETDKEAAILDGALALLETHGPDGLNVRAVCEAAGVKAPTLYHYFGDKDGLERAVVRRGLKNFMQLKRQATALVDPIDQLREGWNIALEFAINHPALYALLTQHVRNHPSLVADAYTLMQSRVQRLVDMGRFCGPVDVTARAIWAASQGAHSLVFLDASREEIEMVSDILFEAVVGRVSKVL